MKGLNPREIHGDMVAILGNNASTISMVQKWAAEFKRNRDNFEDAPQPGRLKTATNDENVDLVHNTVMSDRRFTLSLIADAVWICCERVHNINRNLVWRRFLFVGDTPFELRLKGHLACHVQDKPGAVWNESGQFHHTFLNRGWVLGPQLWTGDQRSILATESTSSPPPKKARVVSSGKKVMVSDFWYSTDTVYVDYLPKDETINGKCCAHLLMQVREAVMTMCPGKLTKRVLFH